MSDNTNIPDDEDKMIEKLEQHRDTKRMVIEIGKLNGITVEPTVNNNGNGDFVYDEKDHEKLIEAIDEFLLDYKYKGEE